MAYLGRGVQRVEVSICEDLVVVVEVVKDLHHLGRQELARDASQIDLLQLLELYVRLHQVLNGSKQAGVVHSTLS